MATVSILRLAHCGAVCPRVASTIFIQKRNRSDVTLTNYKRGRGGRSSFSGVVATVFGGTGLVGRTIVNRLGKVGSQVVIPYRGDSSEVAPLKLCGDLGQILFLHYQMDDEDAIRKSIQYSNVVINLIGADHETSNWNFRKVHVDGPRAIARIARECGVEKLLHFSAMNASPNPQKIYLKSGSEFLKSKYYGELAVKEEFPDATIFRPSEIFGNDDRFMRYYCNSGRRMAWGMNKMPLWNKGNSTVKYPVYVSDVADGIMNALNNPDSVGKTYELLGPEPYYLSDLIEYFLEGTRLHECKINEIGPLFALKVFLQKFNIMGPFVTWERIERDMVTDNPTGAPTLEDLGVNLTRIEEKAMFILKSLRIGSYYDEALGEFQDTPPPPAANFASSVKIE